MKLVEIVSHCYAKELSHYASALCYQLSGFVLDPPRRCRVLATVCCVADDWRTQRVLAYFNLKTPIRTVILPTVVELGRRCIGRNYAARSSQADYVWFADVDQVWQGWCLDRLVDMTWPGGAAMVFPKKIMIHRDHVTGDQATKAVDEPRVVALKTLDFIEKRYNRAIGGVQIVPGQFARQYGYLGHDPKWQQPQTGRAFGDFHDDIAYRTFCQAQGGVVGVDLPGMYRIRHTTTSYQAPKQ